MASRVRCRTFARPASSGPPKPRFRSSDFAGGAEAAADQIMRAARGEPYRGSGRTHAEGGGLLDGPPPFWMWPALVGALGLGARRGAHRRDGVPAPGRAVL